MLEQLEKVAMIPNGVTYGDLGLNPWWDELRGDPRFDKIVAAAKVASRYSSQTPTLAIVRILSGKCHALSAKICNQSGLNKAMRRTS